MSIFKETFRGFVKKQLQTRQRLQSQGFGDTKSNEALVWNTNKQCVIRATSLVDYAQDIGLELGGKGFTQLNGNQLSKQFILQGGVASNDLYGGLGDFGSAYGNPLLASDGEDNLDGYGQVPMPGITSLEVETKSAYGSLKRAKLNITIHNLRQLEVLELLYLRPGYPIVVEWGWDPYISNDGEITPQNLNIENILGTKGKSLFSNDIDQASIYRAIYDLRSESDGNADAFLGFISNFGFQAREDGGFDCFAELTSMGETLNSLKITPFKIPGNPDLKAEFVLDETDEEIKNPDAIKAIILLLLKYAEDIDTSKVEKEGLFNDVDNSSEVTETFINYITTEFLKGIDPNDSTAEDAALANFILKKDSSIDSAALNAFINTSYIRWDLLVFLLNEFAIPKIPDTPKGESTTEIVTSRLRNKPGGVVTEALQYVNYKGTDNKSQLDISCDPTVCILPHSFLDEDLGETAEGLGEVIQDVGESLWRMGGRTWRKLWRGGASGGNTTTQIEPPEGDVKTPIGGIFINIRHLLKVYDATIRDKDEPDLGNFIKKLWDDINTICPLHNFVMKIDDEYPNQVYIMDLPVDNNDVANIANIYTVPVQASDSIVRSYNLEAKVPDALKSTIAVHAQDPGNPQDLEDVSFNAFNRAIRNRLFQKEDEARIFAEESTEASNNPLGKLVKERQQLKRQYQKLKATYFQIINGYENTSTEDSGDKIDDLTTTLKRLQTVIMQETNLRDREVNTSTVIPLEFSMTFDGISGIVIGNVFKIDESRLPRAYRKGESTQSLKGRSEVGFIAFGESQKITAGQDWVTDINGKMILLPGKDFGKERPDSNDFDERAGVYVNNELRGNEGVEISDEQTFIPDDIDNIGIGDQIYLKINGDPTNIRTSQEVDNDVGWYDFDDNIVAIVPAGNRGLLLGTVTEQFIQEREDDVALWYKFRASEALEEVAIDESSFDFIDVDEGEEFWIRVDVIQTTDKGATERVFNLNNQ